MNTFHKFLRMLNSPYPCQTTLWRVVVMPSCIIFLILYLLQPFGISHMEHGRWMAATGSALISAGSSAVFAYLLPALFPRYYAERRWTVGKYVLNLLGLFLLIAVGVCSWVAWLSGNSWGWKLFFYSLLWVLLLAPFPTVLFVMWNYNARLKHNLQEALALNAALARNASPAREEMPGTGITDAVLHFQGTTRESLQVRASDFLYAESEGNYVRVTYRTDKGGKPAQRLLRITLKQAEEAASACPSVVRCHRAFLVNLDKVTGIAGNSQGCRLHLSGCDAELPVSRAYVRSLKEHLEA